MKLQWTDRYEMRRIAGEFVLVPRGDWILRIREPLVINETAAEVLQMIRNGCDSKELLLGQLCKEYEATETEITEDLNGILKKMQQSGVLFLI